MIFLTFFGFWIGQKRQVLYPKKIQKNNKIFLHFLDFGLVKKDGFFIQKTFKRIIKYSCIFWILDRSKKRGSLSKKDSKE